MVGSPAGGGNNHVTVLSGSWDGFVPPVAVIVFLVHIGHVGQNPSGLPLANVEKGSIQCVTYAQAGQTVVFDQPVKGVKFRSVPIWCMGSGAVGIGASQYTFALAMGEPEGSLALSANNQARYIME